MEAYCWLTLPVAGCWVIAQACVCRLCGDLKTTWRLSLSDEMRVGGVLYTRRAIQIDVFTFTFLVVVVNIAQNVTRAKSHHVVTMSVVYDIVMTRQEIYT